MDQREETVVTREQVLKIIKASFWINFWERKNSYCKVLTLEDLNKYIELFAEISENNLQNIPYLESGGFDADPIIDNFETSLDQLIVQLLKIGDGYISVNMDISKLLKFPLAENLYLIFS